ncbi:hypothetical protein GO685_00695 [Wolbachia endosymbiont of Madathamugadia hiepei]|uniref:hypothetical protein n=1 Tax=Wolbachia endosymbiont of Madathamugadia hiepei TaxID=1241303 RepID=UPI00158CF056|nr:hypothetical protein [Wolbachia endosymbiont of Madathamugadia hiepei]NUX01046.1 hypothetical protein [Wolbachia endosymbiont of Madathamugadia hiepei]
MQVSSSSQLGHIEKNGSPDGGYISDNNVELKPISPLHPEPKSGKPQVLSKPAYLQIKSKAPPVKRECDTSTVDSEIKDPPTLSFKERVRRFGD